MPIIQRRDGDTQLILGVGDVARDSPEGEPTLLIFQQQDLGKVGDLATGCCRGPKVFLRFVSREGLELTISALEAMRSRLPSERAVGVAARVWCDPEMGHVVMDQEACLKIAGVVDGLL